ncbi:DoxX family protein [Cryptosporangium aurantiacum]|uniref:Putative oxidoreductase n=1 Tax=Cryptosporangium aurantiacum TaxID=134849 RepID=A0A1M7PK00_9ACTN|nr:DoxX family protein [Cryptosporangium aurantiacum]SHN17521.1 putative oxidoreductase [Cryptosporangium aurantiacum]
MTAVDTGVLLIRLVVGTTMLMHAWNHWFGGGRIAGTAGWFESLGLRPGRVHAWASVAAEIAAGLGLILGLLTSLACAAAIGPMVVAGIAAHRRNGFFVFRDGWEYVLVLAVVSAAVALIGPGQASADDVLDIVIRGPLGFAIATVGGVGGAALLLAVAWRPASGSAA